MSHTVHPYAHRLVILRDWKSRWFATDEKYRENLRADTLLRKYLEKRLRGLGVGSIEMERQTGGVAGTMKILLKSARPGMIIGRSGEGAVKLKNDVLSYAKRMKVVIPQSVKIDIEEIKFPEGDAKVAGEMIAEGLEKRLPFRRVLKQMIEKIMANREVKGARIAISGRLGGADMSRSEEIKRGNIPLQTFRADIDFAKERVFLPYGTIGIKVWIYKGQVFEKDRKAQAAKPVQ